MYSLKTVEYQSKKISSSVFTDPSIWLAKDPKLVRLKNTPAYADYSIQSFKHLASEQFCTIMYVHMSKYHHHISNNFCYFEAFSNQCSS